MSYSHTTINATNRASGADLWLAESEEGSSVRLRIATPNAGVELILTTTQAKRIAMDLRRTANDIEEFIQ